MSAASGPIPRLYTLAQARWILSRVLCVDCLPEDGPDGFATRWFPGIGNAECSRCPCTIMADLRLWIASETAAERWRESENAARRAAGITEEGDDGELLGCGLLAAVILAGTKRNR